MKRLRKTCKFYVNFFGPNRSFPLRKQEQCQTRSTGAFPCYKDGCFSAGGLTGKGQFVPIRPRKF